MKRATESLTTTEYSLYHLREELAARYSSLTAIEGMANSFGDAGWAELSGPKAAEAGVDGVIGPLVDLLEIQLGYEKAIEAVLGNCLRATDVEGLAEARSALEFLKRSGVRTQHLDSEESTVGVRLRKTGSDAVGHRGRAVRGVDEPEFRSSRICGGLRSHARRVCRTSDGLLGDVRIVRDFGSAVSIWRQGTIMEFSPHWKETSSIRPESCSADRTETGFFKRESASKSSGKKPRTEEKG